MSVVEPGVIKTPFHDTSLAEAEGMLSKEAKELYPAFYTEEAVRAHLFRHPFTRPLCPCSRVMSALSLPAPSPVVPLLQKQYRDQIMSRGASVKEVSAAIVHATSRYGPLPLPCRLVLSGCMLTPFRRLAAGVVQHASQDPLCHRQL